ncbi:hypothetical protein BT93_H2693 [Corymbia citriodora subsp. variegata]|nr:hypothetical protein BT93_H2693 [Corymbia citriodora subsp. variegata]
MLNEIMRDECVTWMRCAQIMLEKGKSRRRENDEGPENREDKSLMEVKKHRESNTTWSHLPAGPPFMEKLFLIKSRK